MIPINPGFFYSLGEALHPLKGLEAGLESKDVMPALYGSESYLSTLLGNTDIPIRTARNYGQKLLATIRRVKDAVEARGPLDWHEAYTIDSELDKFTTVLLAELQVSDVYYVSQKGGYDTVSLIEHGENFLPLEIRIELTFESLEDFKQGCRCLAFELATAAGFHFIRTTEAVLHSYYDVMTNGRARPTFKDGQPAAMGSFIYHVEQHGSCNPKTISTLRQLNKLHRNSLVHPEDVLTMTQAIILFGMIISAIAAMVDEMKERATATASGLHLDPDLIASALETDSEDET
jgi:hypothetical protein